MACTRNIDDIKRNLDVSGASNDHIDGATIYRDCLKTDPNGEDSSVSVADWNVVSPITPSTAMKASLSTAEPSTSWSQVGAVEALRPGVRYVAYGWTGDNTWSMGAVEFTLERLSRLELGQVLTQTYVRAKGEDADIVQSYRQFESSTES